MRVLLFGVSLLAGCDSESVEADTGDLDTETERMTPAVDLVGDWIVPNGDPLPGMTDRSWCNGTDLDEWPGATWEESGDEVTCWDSVDGGCQHELTFHEDGTMTRWVRFVAAGPCPYDGVQRKVLWSETLNWGLLSTTGEEDTYQVGFRYWTVSSLGALVVLKGGPQPVSLSPGRTF